MRSKMMVLRAGASALSLLAAVSTAPAMAQSDPAAQQDVEAVVVTGTAIRGVAPVGSATVNVSRETLVEAPARDPAALISSLPQGSGLGSTLTNSGGRAAGVNLRGLGNNATLLLFDGHRVTPQGVVGQIADPNQIPFAAIERVEVVTDGASAIYGSDAVAGVVNYILRRDFQGMEVTARFDHTLYDRKVVEGVGGFSWNGGNAMVGLTYEDGDSVRRSRRDYLLQDLRPYGGVDNRFVGTSVFIGNTPAVRLGNTIYGVPATNGRVPTAAEVLALANNPSLSDLSEFQDFYAARERLSGVARIRQNIGESVEVTYTGMFNRRSTTATAADQGFNNIALTVTPASPYYIQGLTATPANQTVLYNFRNNNPDFPLTQNGLDKSYNHTVQVVADLPRDFRLTTYATFGESRGCGACQNQVNTAFFPVISQSPYASAFNPYVQGPQKGAELLIERVYQNSKFRQYDGVAKVDGVLFDLPGGSVRGAAGVEYTETNYRLVYKSTLNVQQQLRIARNTNTSRNVKSGFAEIFVPIVGGSNEMRFIKRLDLSAAIRYDDYSDFGSTSNPKIGVTWKPHDDLSLRGSWGTAFRAPTLVEITPGSLLIYNRAYVANATGSAAFPLTLPASGQSAFLTRIGNSNGLQPETAKVWSIGADYNPSWMPGFRGSLTYYNVNYKDRIEALPGGATIFNSAANLNLFNQFVVSAPQPSTCVAGNFATYNPAYLPYLTEQGANYIASSINDCTLVGVIRGGQRNLGTVKQDGLDVSASYRWNNALGDFNVGGSFSKIFNLDKNLVSGGAFFNALDTIGFQLSERGRFNAGYMRDGLSINGYLNYTGSYLNNQPITIAGVRQAEKKVPAWVTLDAQIAYRMLQESGPLQGVRVSLGVQNFTNERPPIVLSGANAVDLNNANPFGRIWTLEFTKKF